MNIKSAFIRKRNNNYNVYIEYVDENGKLKQKSQAKYETKKDAEKHLIDIKNSINKNKFILTKNISFVDRCYQYLETKERRLSPVTIEVRNSVIRVNIIPFFKDIKLGDVTPSLLQIFADNLFYEYSKDDAKNRLIFVKSVLNEAYRLKEINDNPCSSIKVPNKSLAKKKTSEKVEVYNKDEVREIIQKLKGEKIEVPILLMLTLGLRAGEVCGLRWQDIDFNNNTIAITQNSVYISGKGIVFKSPKTEDSIRTLSVPIETMQILKKWKIQHNEYRLSNILEYEDIVCLNSKLTPYIQKTLINAWYKFIERNNLRKLTLHDLRHTHSTMLLLSGVNMKIMSKRLGHTDIKITMNRYSHVLEEMDKETSNSISNLMFK